MDATKSHTAYPLRWPVDLDRTRSDPGSEKTCIGGWSCPDVAVCDEAVQDMCRDYGTLGMCCHKNGVCFAEVIHPFLIRDQDLVESTQRL